MNVRTYLPVAFCALSLLMLGASPAPTMLADEPTGSLSVTVLDSKDQPVVNTPVGVFGKPKREVGSQGGSKAPTAKSAIGIEEPTMLQKATIPIANAKTDQKGVAEFKTIKAGDFELRCGRPDKSPGFKKEAVHVDAGKATAVTVKLDPPGGKK